MAIITYLTRIVFDDGALGGIGAEMAGAGIARPLVVTDPGVVAAGLLDRLVDRLPDPSLARVFAETPANPTEASARAALVAWREGACDGVIALGGGSAIDLGKAVRLMATHDGPLADYVVTAGGAARIRADLPGMIAVPTTAGTGAEVGRAALIVLDDGAKRALISQHLIPTCALCDPELTHGLPPGVTAGTGMDAIAHGIETFLSPTVNPPAEAIALDAVARGWAHVGRAVADGGDREARWQMMMAALEGAMAFQKGLGAVHALSHPLGALAEPVLHHGTLNAVLLPAVLRYNAPAVGDKTARLAAAMGLPSGGDPAEAVESMTARLGLPTTLSAMGVPAPCLDAVAEAAMTDHCTATNPRPVDAAAYRAMLAEAYG